MIDVLISWFLFFFAIRAIFRLSSPILLRTLPHAVQPQGTVHARTKPDLFGLMVAAINTLGSNRLDGRQSFHAYLCFGKKKGLALS
jgi:hypothetical protein